MLSLFVDDSQLNLDEILPYVMMSYMVPQGSHHTGCCSVLKLQVDVVMGTQQNEGKQFVSQYVQNVQGYLSTVRGAVKRNHLKSTGKQKQ